MLLTVPSNSSLVTSIGPIALISVSIARRSMMSSRGRSTLRPRLDLRGPRGRSGVDDGMALMLRPGDLAASRVACLSETGELGVWPGHHRGSEAPPGARRQRAGSDEVIEAVRPHHLLANVDRPVVATTVGTTRSSRSQFAWTWRHEAACIGVPKAESYRSVAPLVSRVVSLLLVR